MPDARAPPAPRVELVSVGRGCGLQGGSALSGTPARYKEFQTAVRSRTVHTCSSSGPEFSPTVPEGVGGGRGLEGIVVQKGVEGFCSSNMFFASIIDKG